MTQENAPGDVCAYLGPTIRGVIQRGTIYEGTLETVLERLAPAVAKYPRIEKLIVSGDDLPVARQRVKTKGNYLYEEYRRFVAELQKGV